MTKTKLRQAVEDLGKLRAEKAAIAAAERQLTGQITEALLASTADQVASAHYVAQLAAATTLTIDPKRLRRKADDKTFMACVRIDTKTARRHFTVAQLAKLGTTGESVRLRISPRPGR